MTDRREFTDQDLSCYLDGEAAPDLMSALNAALKTDPALQARLETLRAAQKPFDAAFEAALKLAPQMPVLPAAQPRAANSNWKIALAGVAVGAIAAFGLTWATAPTPQKSRWIDDVALYQSLYVAETLALINIAPAESQEQLDHISQTLGFDLTDLPQVAGLTLKRVQQLAYNNKPLAQITFVNAMGNPVALCVIRTNGENTPAIKSQQLRGQNAFTWSEDGYGILLIGPADDFGLEEAAKTFRNALKDVAI